MPNKEENKNNNRAGQKNVKEYVLRLFITGATPNSVRALKNIKKICEENLRGRYSLEIIDVYKQEEIAEREQLVALPLLIKEAPLPKKRMIGDLSDTQKVLTSLGLIQ